MVKHVILWNLKDEITGDERIKIKNGVKSGLESLVGKVPGLLEVKVNIEPLQSSNADIILDSTCENEEALKVYASHQEHVKVANEKIRPFMKQRVCIDYKI